jgi:putative transposase
MLAGRQKEIHDARDRKLEEAREHRAQVRREMRQQSVAERNKACYIDDGRTEDKALLGSNLSAASTALAKSDVEVPGPPVTPALAHV